MKISFFNLNKLNKFIKVHKDSPNEKKKNIVYMINCRDCDALYKKWKVAKHRNNIRRNPFSIISEHRMYYNHDFINWNDVEIWM